MKAVLETKRLVLRNFRLSDAESMFESYCHNENITRYLTWYPHVDVQATRDFITQFQLPGIEKDNALDLAITLKGEDQVKMCIRDRYRIISRSNCSDRIN